MTFPIDRRPRFRVRAALLPACVAALFTLSMPVGAQDTTRGVRIGLAYDPGSKPGVIVLPVAGAQGDSVRAILSRDLDFSDRINVIALDADASRSALRGGAPNWGLLGKLGAAVAVQVTPTASGLHVAVYNVATKQTALIRDYATAGGARERRATMHGLADDLEESFTGTRGIARTRVLFERGRRIWMVDSDGELAVPVGDVPTAASPAWSATGQRFTYSTYVPSQIVVQEFGGRPRVAASGAGVFISPTFTPDGSSIVYAHGVDEGVDLFVVPAAGGAGRRLSIGRGSDNVSPSFSPDGRRLVFMSGRAGHPEIYTMDADGTNVDLLTPLDLGESAYRASPDWSPDGRLVAFQSRIAGTFQVMTVNLRDRTLHQLTSDGRNEDPSWAPDGRHVVFVSDRAGSRQLWVLDAESGRTRQLTHGSPARMPAWSPRLGR
jgi:TolB protein